MEERALHGQLYQVKFSPPESIEEMDRLLWLPQYVNTKSELFQRAKVGGGTLWITWWGYQGNTEYRPEVLQEIAKTGMPLAVDYVYIKDDPE